MVRFFSGRVDFLELLVETTECYGFHGPFELRLGGMGGRVRGDGLKGTNNLFVHQSQTIHPSPFNVAHASVVFRLLLVDSHTKIRKIISTLQ